MYDPVSGNFAYMIVKRDYAASLGLMWGKSARAGASVLFMYLAGYFMISVLPGTYMYVLTTTSQGCNLIMV